MAGGARILDLLNLKEVRSRNAEGMEAVIGGVRFEKVSFLFR